MTLICFYQGFFLTVTGFGFTLFVLGIICLCRMVRLKRKSKTESAEPGKRNDLRFCIPIAPPLVLGCVCTMAIQYMVMALKPLHDVKKIKRVVVSTYQAVSGGGKEAMAELEQQVDDIVNGRPVKAEILPGASLAKHYQIAFNLIPQIDVFKENLYTKEEMKMIDETRKIMSAPDMRITATTVRVPGL